jgi:hypothetical protein
MPHAAPAPQSAPCGAMVSPPMPHMALASPARTTHVLDVHTRSTRSTVYVFIRATHSPDYSLHQAPLVYQR